LQECRILQHLPQIPCRKDTSGEVGKVSWPSTRLLNRFEYTSFWVIGEGGWGILKTLFPLIKFFCDLALRLQIQKGSMMSQQIYFQFHYHWNALSLIIIRFIHMRNKSSYPQLIGQFFPQTFHRCPYGRGSGVNVAKSCILAISWHHKFWEIKY
jgi:hypothetical protein